MENEYARELIIKCVDCGSDFTLTPGEQSFYREEMKFPLPKRCSICRAINRANKVKAVRP